MLIFALLMWLSKPFLLHIPLTQEMRIICLLMSIIFGILITLAGAYSFKKAKTTVNPTSPESTSALVTSGIYQYTRNPMYLGFSSCLIGWMIFLSSPVSIIYVLAFIFYMTKFQIEPEEKMLMSLFKDNYISYQQQVRRWI